MMTSLSSSLTTWLPQQRWYAGKGRDLSVVEVRSLGVLAEGGRPGEAPGLEVFLAEVRHPDGPAELYQLPLSLHQERSTELESTLAGQLERDGTTWYAYDALHDKDVTAVFLHRMNERATAGEVRFGRPEQELDADLHSRPIGVEQSNSSVVYGEDYILKLFRRLSTGTNPDLEVTRALGELGSTHVIPPLGWLETSLDGEPVTLGMLQPFLRTATDGWRLATTSVRDLYAEADLHAEEVGGDFAAEAERLGAATAQVHAEMAQAFPTLEAGPAEHRATADQLLERLETATAVVPELAPYAEALHAAYQEVGRRTEPVTIQRVHGDFHLGQVLRSETGWVLLDFEGEPARSFAERTALMSPLRDVAGMLRSFDYAARHLLADRPGNPGLTYRATEWAERNRSAFCDGYAAAAGSDPRDESALLRAFELDKAVYEVVYEARNRPGWLPIPLGSIERLVATP